MSEESEEYTSSFGLRPVVKRIKSERDELAITRNKLADAKDRIAALEAWREQAYRSLRTFGEQQPLIFPTWSDSHVQCRYCSAEDHDIDVLEHGADCPWLFARQVAEHDGEGESK